MALLNTSLSMGSRFSWLTDAIVSRLARRSEHGCLERFQNRYLALISEPDFVPDIKALFILYNLSTSALLRGDLPERYKIESIIQTFPFVANEEVLSLRSKTRVVFTDFVKGRFKDSFAQLNRIEKALAVIPENNLVFEAENYLLLTEVFGALYLKWFDRAERAADKARRRVEKHYGMRSLQSAVYKQLLVEIYLDQGELEKAQDLLREVLIIHRHHLDADSLDLAATYLLAARLDTEKEMFDQAEAFLALVEKTYFRVIRSSNLIDFPQLYVARARLAHRRGDREACFDFASQALSEFAGYFPSDHPVLADALALAALASETERDQLKMRLERIVGRYKMHPWNELEQLREIRFHQVVQSRF